MELHTDGNPETIDEAGSDLSVAISKILENARAQMEEEFRKQLESAVRDAESTSKVAAGTEMQQALADAQAQLSTELRAQFDQTLQENTARMQAEFEQQLSAATKEWEAEKGRLQEQIDMWRGCADAQRQMGESQTQVEILGHFLDRAEPFATNLAVYVAKADGLALWKTRGSASFPQVVSKDKIDAGAYFKTIVVRDKIVAAVFARQPLKPEALDSLSGALARAIEAFGMKLQTRTPAAVS
jgi:hypothetical protein